MSATLVAPLIATLFAASAIWSLTVITRMMGDYSDRIVAALLFEPMPRAGSRPDA